MRTFNVNANCWIRCTPGTAYHLATTIPTGASTGFWGCIWAAGTGKLIRPEQRQPDFSGCLCTVDHSWLKICYFSPHFILNQPDNVCIFSSKDSTEKPKRLMELLRLFLLVGGFRWIISWEAVCFWRHTFSQKKEQGRIKLIRGCSLMASAAGNEWDGGPANRRAE